MPRSFVECPARMLIITIICQDPRFSVQTVGPVRIIEGRGQNDESRHLLAAEIPESTLIADTDQARKRIVPGISGSSAFINCIDDEIACFKVSEWETLHGDLLLRKLRF